MPLKATKKVGAVFDIKPVDDTGRVAVRIIDAVDAVVDLKPKPSVRDEFESLFNHEIDLKAELAKFGGQTESPNSSKPRYRVIQKKPVAPDSAIIFEPIVAEIHHSARTSYGEPATEAEIEYTPIAEESAIDHSLVASFYTHNSAEVEPPIKFGGLTSKWIVVAVLIIAGLLWYVGSVKNEIIRDSGSAVENLQDAEADLKAMNFEGASDDFMAAYANFSRAGDNLNVMGATLSSMIAELPGASSIKSAKKLIDVGRLLADAGAAMTTAMDAVARTGVLLNPTSGDAPIGDIMNAFKQALNISKRNVSQAVALIADVDPEDLPADKRGQVIDLKSKLPLFEETINQSADYAKFFEDFIGSGEKSYLILFENASELRPTGGFPGTYAVVSFKNGKLADFFVDDVYNLDGQIKEQIIPPRELQHITPTWGMRDANWSVDFPASARKIREFYKRASGDEVDGVIAINPKLVAEILKIVGPIRMPAYDLTLTADNLLVTIQDEVEYGANRTQPKQIVKDFGPLLLEKIYSANSDNWLAIFNQIIAAMAERKIIMHFSDLELQRFVIAEGFGGQVNQTLGDYLMVTLSNIKGSKTDAVTDTALAVDTQFTGDDAVHTITIARQHTGGKLKYGFYNKQNPAYVRVLVPENAVFQSISGNDQPSYKPLVDYRHSSFKTDPDLVDFEKNVHVDNSRGVTTYREAGKAEFGFWLITDPGISKTVTLKYRVPNVLNQKSYELYVQKQPGLEIKDFDFSMAKPEGLTPTESHPLLERTNSNYSWSDTFSKDLQFKIKFR